MLLLSYFEWKLSGFLLLFFLARTRAGDDTNWAQKLGHNPQGVEVQKEEGQTFLTRDERFII